MLSCFSRVQPLQPKGLEPTHGTLLFMGHSMQEYCNIEMPGPSPEDLPGLGLKSASLKSPALAGRFFTTSATWEALIKLYGHKFEYSYGTKWTEELHGLQFMGLQTVGHH